MPNISVWVDWMDSLKLKGALSLVWHCCFSKLRQGSSATQQDCFSVCWCLQEEIPRSPAARATAAGPAVHVDERHGLHAPRRALARACLREAGSVPACLWEHHAVLSRAGCRRAQRRQQTRYEEARWKAGGRAARRHLLATAFCSELRGLGNLATVARSTQGVEDIRRPWV